MGEDITHNYYNWFKFLIIQNTVVIIKIPNVVQLQFNHLHMNNSFYGADINI